MTRAVPQAAIDLVKQVEGLRLTAYQDVAGVWTIGFGSTSNVLPGETINEAQATLLLQGDLETAAARLANVVDEAVILTLTDNQYAALLSFVFNLGANPSWTIWKVLNAKQFDQVPQQLIRFVYAGNPPVKVQGLVNRRTAEINLFSLDEPGSIDTSPSSSVTRATATPAVPIDPKPRGLAVIASTAIATTAAAIPQAQGALQAVSDAVTPYRDSAAIIGHVLSLVGVAGAGLAVSALVLKYLHDRSVKGWSKSTAPALHPTTFASESNVNPNPPPGATVIQPATVTQAPSQPVVPSGAGSTITADLADLRDSIARCLTKLSGEAQSFAGKTVSEIIADVKKLAASVESKL